MTAQRGCAIWALALGCCFPPPASAQAGDGDATIETADGRRVGGRLAGRAASGFRFIPDGSGTPLSLETTGPIRLPGRAPDPSAAPPPFRVVLGAGQRLSGRLMGLTRTTLTLATESSRMPLTIRRQAVQALLQRPGEALLLAERFERLDPSRWTVQGRPAVLDETPEHARGLRLPAAGSSITWTLVDPLASGRLEVLYDDDARRAAGQRWFVEMTFRAAQGNEPIQAILGWDDEVLSVRSRGGGPALGIQRLLRRAGRHRLAASFGAERTDLALDGDELAHGDPPPGPLIALRLATEAAGSAAAPADLAAIIREVRLVRFASPTAQVEVDPGQDEARLVSGDQVFGAVLEADPEGVRLDVDGRPARLSWAEIAGLHFRRERIPSEPLEGLWVQVAWRAAPGDEPEGLDRIEGVLTEVDEASVSVSVPHVGTLAVPRPRLVELRPLGRMRRMMLDATPHHLGNMLVPDLDPPQPEGSSLEVAFDLDAPPPGASRIALDVVQIVGIDGNPDFSAQVRRGELLTRALLNGQELDTLNRHVTTRNDTPLRIALAVPAGLLREGRNVLRFEQKGLKDDPETLDNLGLSRIALESDSPRPTNEAPQP
jgi:hypothetical protein